MDVDGTAARAIRFALLILVVPIAYLGIRPGVDEHRVLEVATGLGFITLALAKVVLARTQSRALTRQGMIEHERISPRGSHALPPR